MTNPRRSLDDGGGSMSSPAPMQSPPVSEPTLRSRKGWPGVIGTISIILGSLGVLCWGCNTGSSVFGMIVPESMTQSTSYEVSSETALVEEGLSSTVVEDGDDAAPAATAHQGEEEAASSADSTPTTTTTTTTSFEIQPLITVEDIIVSFASFGLSIWLLVGGIGLLGRKHWSVKCLKVWSLLRILVTIGWGVVSFLSIDQQIELFQEQMQADAAAGGSAMNISIEMLRLFMIIFFAVTFLFFLSWPVFLLLFLGRESVRSEVASWGGNQSIIGGHPEA